jgi:outer membrane protein, adhesin transport system
MKSLQGVCKLLGAAVLAPCLVASAWAARCGDELLGEVRSAGKVAQAQGAGTSQAPEKAAPQMDPLVQLQLIAREASQRSAAYGASRLLAEAAEFDLGETRGGLWPQLSISADFNRRNSRTDSAAAVNQSETGLSLKASQPLYDGGRLFRLTEYRQELSKAARLGASVQQEQVVFEAVTAALERSRYKMQAQVYQQYMRKMSCLVEALESIVAQDRGRASELVQVRKTHAQTELQRDQALSQSRQAELKLRRLVGELPGLDDGLTLPLATVPDTGEVMRLIENGHEARQLRAQADAADSFVQAVKAGQMPQVSWNVTSSDSKLGKQNVSSWQAGVSVSYSLFNGFSDEPAKQAALRRAQAARQQLQELLNTRVSRTAEVHDVASSAFDRAKRYVEVLRDSEQVRNFTFQQWSQMGRRSLFDVMSAESDHFNLRIAYVNALYDGYQASAQLRSMGKGLAAWLASE